MSSENRPYEGASVPAGNPLEPAPPATAELQLQRLAEIRTRYNAMYKPIPAHWSGPLAVEFLLDYIDQNEGAGGGVAAMTEPTTAATVVHLVWHGSELRGIYGTRERADTARAVLDEQEAAEYGPLALRTEVTTVEVR